MEERYGYIALFLKNDSGDTEDIEVLPAKVYIENGEEYFSVVRMSGPVNYGVSALFPTEKEALEAGIAELKNQSEKHFSAYDKINAAIRRHRGGPREGSTVLSEEPL